MYKIGQKVKIKDKCDRGICVIIDKFVGESSCLDIYKVKIMCDNSTHLCYEDELRPCKSDTDCSFKIGDRVKTTSEYSRLVTSRCITGTITKLDYCMDECNKYWHKVATVCTKNGVEYLDTSWLEHDCPNPISVNDNCEKIKEKLDLIRRTEMYNKLECWWDKENCKDKKILEILYPLEENKTLKADLKLETHYHNTILRMQDEEILKLRVDKYRLEDTISTLTREVETLKHTPTTIKLNAINIAIAMLLLFVGYILGEVVESLVVI